MRKTILILHLLLTGWLLPLVCIASEPSPGDDLPPVVPYIDESSVVFDYTIDDRGRCMGTLSFTAKFPLGTAAIVIGKTKNYDLGVQPDGKIIFSYVERIPTDIDTTESQVFFEHISWGAYISFVANEQNGESIMSSNMIYSDDYIAPDDLAEIKPNSDIDTIGDCEPVISFNDDNLEVDISEPFAFELYSLQGQCLTATTYPGKVSIPLNQYGQRLMIARITTSDQTIIRKIAL